MKLSIVIPCYNEEAVIATSYKRFTDVMEANGYDYELLFVNDGSKDRTEELLTGFAQNDSRVKLISFSRNFGHQNAVSAGLHHCTGDVAVIIGAGFEDPSGGVSQMKITY